MIAARELVSTVALHRYDDDGEPAYTTHERVLLVLRWFGWATVERVYEALDINVDETSYADRARYQSAIAYWVKRGRVAKRTDMSVVEYRLIHPSQWSEAVECSRCPTQRVPGKSMCQTHLDWERDYKARRRAA